MADGKITIDTEIQTKRAEAQILSLENRMSKLAAKISQMKAQREVLPSSQFTAVQQEIKKTEDEIDKLAEKMYKAQKKGKSSIFGGLEKQQDSAFAKLEALEASRDAMKASGADKAGPGDSTYDALTQKIREAQAQQSILGKQWDTQMLRMEKRSTTAGSKAGASLASALGLAEKALGSLGKQAQSGFKIMGSAAKKVVGTISGAFSNALKNAKNRLEAVTTHGKSAGDMAEDFGKRVLSLAKTVFVFGLIRRALREVVSGIGSALEYYAKYDSDFNSRISAMQTALLGLQGAFVSAFAPILSVVVPVLTTLIGYITTIINLIGQFFAALTGGWTYKKLIANQKNFAGALDKTGKSAKSAQNNLAKFDDLDVLRKDTGSGSGGAGGGFSGLEESPISAQMKKLADMLKNGQFFDFGNTLADMLADQLEKIPWDKIREKALKAGQILAEILNGVFSNLRFAVDLGKSLAQGINTALDFLYGFITSFNWTQFGVWWGYFFNAFVQSMDWPLLGNTILSGTNGVIAALYAFFNTIYLTSRQLGLSTGEEFQKIFTGINFTGIADTILMGLTDITEVINGWNKSINWTEIADSMLNGVNELALGMVMDPNGTIHQVWAENGTAVGTAIGNFFSGIHEFVSSFPFVQITDDISTWFQSAIAGVNWNELGATIHDLVTGLIDSINQFMEDPANQDSFLGALSGFFSGLDIAEIMDGLLELAGNILSALMDTVESLDWGTIGTLILSAILIGLVATEPVILAVGALAVLLVSLLSKIYDDIKAKTGEWMTGIKAKIQEVGASISAIWSTLWTGIKTFAGTTFEAIKGTAKSFLTAIYELINAKMTAVKAIWTAAWETMKALGSLALAAIKAVVTGDFTGIHDKISETMQRIKSVWSNAWNGMKDTLRGIINSIIGLINGMLDAIAGGINHVIDAMNSLSVDIPDWVPGVGGSHFGLSIGHVSAPHIPTLATGGITTGSTLAQIGEAGREAVLPLEQNTGWMDELAGRLAQLMQERDGGINAVTLEVDGTELARASLDGLVSEIQRRGYTVDTVFA